MSDEFDVSPEEREEMTKKRDEKVKKILAEDKYNGYLEFMKNRRRGMGGPPPGN